MSTNKDDFELASRIIRAVLDGKVTAEVALKEWPAMTKRSDKMIKNAWHLLHHYFADEDIRMRDTKYAAQQRRSLETCVNDLLSKS